MLLKRDDLIYDRSIAKSHRLRIHLNRFLPHPRDYVTKVEIDNLKIISMLAHILYIDLLGDRLKVNPDLSKHHEDRIRKY